MSQQRGVFLVLVAAVFFGTEGIFSKLAYASGVTYLSTVTFRSVFSGLVLLLVLLVTGQGFKVPKKMYRLLGLLAGLFTVIGACLYKALEILPASLAILFFYSFPTFTCIFDYLIKREKLSKPKLLALALSFCGLLLLHFSSFGTLPLTGVFFAFGAALANALFMVLSPMVLKEVHELALTFWMFVCSAIFYLMVGGYTGSLSFGSLTITSWLFLILLALFSTAAANVALIYGLGTIGSTTAAIVQTVEPVVTAILAFIVFKEKLAGWQVFGAMLIIAAVLIPNLNLDFTNRIKDVQKV